MKAVGPQITILLYAFYMENILFCIERVTYQELPQSGAKCNKKGLQKGRAKRAPLLLRPCLLHFALFWGSSWYATLSVQNSRLKCSVPSGKHKMH